MSFKNGSASSADEELGASPLVGVGRSVVIFEREFDHEDKTLGAATTVLRKSTLYSVGRSSPLAGVGIGVVIFERVEEESIDKAIGIPKDDPWFLRAVLLLRKRVQIEVEEAKTYTTKVRVEYTTLDLLLFGLLISRPIIPQAQGLLLATASKVTQEQQLTADHQDGEKHNLIPCVILRLPAGQAACSSTVLSAQTQ